MHFLRGLYAIACMAVAILLWPIIGLALLGREWSSDSRDADPLGALVVWMLGCLLVAPMWARMALFVV